MLNPTSSKGTAIQIVHIGIKQDMKAKNSSIEALVLLDRAIQCGEWMVRNQMTDRQDANKGRSVRSYDADTGEKILTGNWMTGTMLMGLLALYKRTGSESYLRAAELAGRYIMSLQVMGREEEYFGAIRELTPQSIEFAPRDAASAAWGLAWLAEATGDALYLHRAELYGDWLVEKGMYRGWPLYAIYMDERMANFYSRGSFQSGSGLFLHDLFQLSGNPKYIERGLAPIAKIYRDEFINDDGSLTLERDPFTGRITSPKPGSDGLPMHAFNDDFGAAMMIAATRFFDDQSYIEKAARYAHWLASVQDEDGGFAEGKVPSAVPVSEMTFRDIGTILKDSELLKVADRSMKKLLEMQFPDTGDPCIDGGFHGLYEGEESDRWGRTCVNMRTSSYALIALLKAESDLEGIWLGLHNKPFQDQRWVGPHDLVW